MKFAHCLTLVACTGLCASMAFADEPVALKYGAAPLATEPFQIAFVTNVMTGQTIKNPGNGPAPRGPIVGYDNLSLPASSAMLNVAYVTAGSYNGSDPSTSAFFFGLGNGAAGSQLRAPTNGGIPTDIVWNEFTGNPAVWPGGAGVDAACSEFDIVVALQNTTGIARVDTLRVLFFSADRLTVVGGFQVGINTPGTTFAYGRLNVDLSLLTPPVMVPQNGFVMADYLPVAPATTISGVGLSLAGGDLVNATFPTPESLVAVGTIDSGNWNFADHVSGDATHPTGPDPLFDMVDGLSYIDIFNTGRQNNWGFTSAAPVHTFTHDFPCRMVVGNPPPLFAACVFAEQNNCFIALEADCVAAGGVFHPEIADCGNPGACCLSTGCELSNYQAVCTARSGMFAGDFIACEQANCPPPAATGACCVSEVCSVVTLAACDTAHGSYQGDGSVCGASTCAPPPVCPCNFNNDAFLNSQDFFDFIACFFTVGCPQADYNHDTFSNSQDFFDFLTCFFAPPATCP